MSAPRKKAVSSAEASARWRLIRSHDHKFLQIHPEGDKWVADPLRGTLFDTAGLAEALKERANYVQIAPVKP